VATIYPENQLIKFSAVDLLQFKHSEKMSCFVCLLCCFAGQYRLHIEGNLNGSGSAHEELSSLTRQFFLGTPHILNFWPIFCIKMDKKLSASGEAPGWGLGDLGAPTSQLEPLQGSAPYRSYKLGSRCALAAVRPLWQILDPSVGYGVMPGDVDVFLHLAYNVNCHDFRFFVKNGFCRKFNLKR